MRSRSTRPVLALTTLLVAVAGGLALPSVAAPWHPPGADGTAIPRIAPGIHTELEASDPSAGDTVDVMPQRVRLEFNQAVDPSVGELRITGNGTAYRLEPVSDEDDAAIVRADAPRLPAGAFRIHWRVLSPDGHAVSGTIDFVIAVGETAAAVTPDRSAAAPVEIQAGREEEPRTRLAELSVRLARGVGVGALLALVGWLAFATWLTPAVRAGRGVALTLAIIATLGLALHLVRWIDYIAPPGLAESQAFARDALATTAGRFELLRLIGVVLATFLLLVRAVRWAALPAAAAAVLSGFIGHGAGEGVWMVAVKALHLLAVAGWFGGVLALAAGAIGSIDDPGVAQRVSRVALFSVIVVALTGLWQTIQLLPSLDLLFTSAWGRLLLAKLAGLAVLVAFGAYHRFRLIPGLGDPPGALRRSVRFEAAVMVVVLLIAGFLAYTPPPETIVALR